MRKNAMLVLLFAFLLMIVTACNKAEAEQKKSKKDSGSKEKITLKLAVNSSEVHPIHESTFVPFMEEVTEKTNGQVEFEYYPSEQLGQIADLYELTSDGVVDIGVFVPSYIPSKMPVTSGLLGIPGMYSSTAEGSLAYDKLTKKSPVLESDYLNNGVRPIFIVIFHPSEILTTGKEIKVPGDLKGKSVRVTGDLINKAVTELGASPVNITVSEFYEALERGVVDIINTDPVNMDDFGLSELAKYVTRGLAFGASGYGLVMNEKVFQDLPEDIQEVIKQAGDQAAINAANLYEDAAQKVYEKFKDNGINVYELSEDDKAQWQKFYSEMEESWMKGQNNPDLEATIEEFRKEIKSESE